MANQELTGNKLTEHIAEKGLGDYVENTLSEEGSTKTRRLKDGKEGAALQLETGLVQDRQNSIIQFSVDNSGNTGTDLLMRVGGWAGLPNTNQQYDNLSAGAADDGTITDEVGTGLKKVQGFSQITIGKAVIIAEIKVLMNSADTQLNKPIVYKSLQLDGTIDSIRQSVAYSKNEEDDRENISSKRGIWVLDAQQFIEYEVLAGKQFDFFMNVVGFENTQSFNQIIQ